MKSFILPDVLKSLFFVSASSIKIHFDEVLSLLLFYYDNYLRIKENATITGLGFNSNVLIFGTKDQNKKEQLSELYDFLDRHFSKSFNKSIDVSLFFDDHIIKINMDKNFPCATTIKGYDYKGRVLKNFISFPKLYDKKNQIFFGTNKKMRSLLFNKHSLAISAHVSSFIQYLMSIDFLKGKNSKNIIKPKQVIECICSSLIPLGEYYSVKFDYKNIDIDLNFDVLLFSRIILAIAYPAVINSAKNSTLDVISYVENRRFVVEFNVEMKSKDIPYFSCPRYINKILSETNSDLSYKLSCKGETLFVFSTPCENIHF